MTDLIGKRLGQYQILEEIGRGGMAVVYKGYQPSLNRYVAIKVLLPHLSQDRELLQRFGREARSAAMLQHSNIIHIYDVGEEGGVHYLVMDYIPGPSLATKLKREGALDSRTALAILRDVGAALDHAHAQGVIHRDVKPSNILFTADGQAILSDFGIARAASESRLTQTGAVVGTPAYMSPEQIEAGTVDGRADLYSLGIVLYEMLTGQVPFQADTPAALLYKQVHVPPPPLSGINPAVSEAAEAVVLRALEKDKNKRYQRASDMVDALAQAVTTQTVHKTPVPPRPLAWYKKALLPLVLVVSAALIVVSISHWVEPDGRPTATPSAVAAAMTTPTPTRTPAPTATRPPPTEAPSSTPTDTPTVTRVPPTAIPSHTPTRKPTAKPSPTPVEIIIDDNDPGFSTAHSQDPWLPYPYDKADRKHWGFTHWYNPQIGTGQDTATWTFTVLQPGQYEVYAWWWGASRRPSDVPYTIYYADGQSTVPVNQQTELKDWYPLGTFRFEGAGRVVVSDDVSSGEHIVADAIRLVFVAASGPGTPTVTLIKGPGVPVYLLEGGVLRWFPNGETFLARGYEWDQIPTAVTLDALLAYPVGEPLPMVTGSKLKDGELVKGSSEKTYVIELGQKRRITEWSVSEKAHGFKEENIARVTDHWLDGIEDGADLSD